MKKTGICPKCNHDKIIIIKDQLHENGGGNISQITNHINNYVQRGKYRKEDFLYL